MTRPLRAPGWPTTKPEYEDTDGVAHPDLGGRVAAAAGGRGPGDLRLPARPDEPRRRRTSVCARPHSGRAFRSHRPRPVRFEDRAVRAPSVARFGGIHELARPQWR